MKKRITKEVNICDRCGREIQRGDAILMFTCPVCEKECCSNCNKRSIFEKFPDICKGCAEIPEIASYLEHLTRVYYRRMKKGIEKLKTMKIYLPKEESENEEKKLA